MTSKEIRTCLKCLKCHIFLLSFYIFLIWFNKYDDAGMDRFPRFGWMGTRALLAKTWITYLTHGLQLFTNCSPMQTFSLTQGQMFDGLVMKQGRQGLRIGPWWIDLLSLLEVERQSKLILCLCFTLMSFYDSHLDWSIVSKFGVKSYRDHLSGDVRFLIIELSNKQ